MPASLDEILQCEYNQDTGSRKSNSLRGNLRSGTLVATSTLSAAVGSLIGAINAGRRIGDFAGTNESSALDNAIVLDLTEGTFEGLRGRLYIDAAANITDTWERSIIERSSPVD